MKIITNKKIVILFISTVFLFIFSKTAFAIWDGFPYNPGETDNPECLPSQTDCDVLPAVTTEVDPIFIVSEAFTITGTDTTNWDTAYGWGNHSGLYLPIGGGTLTGNLALGIHNITSTGSLGATGAGKLLKGWFTDVEITNLPTINGETLATALGNYGGFLTSVGTGVANELTYWSGTNTLGSLAIATYPSLTELSYVKGVTSSIQTQLGEKLPLAGGTLLDQTSPQTIINGAPTFNAGLNVGTTTTGANLNVYATEGAEMITQPIVTGGWTLGYDAGVGGWTITDGVLSKTASTNTLLATAVSGMTSVTPGITYKIRFNITAKTGSSSTYFNLGGVPIVLTTETTGQKEYYIVAGTTGEIVFSQYAGGTITIENISIIPLTKGTGDLTVYGDLKPKGQIQLGESANYPGYSFASKPNTGMGYTQESGWLKFSNSGTVALQLSSTGALLNGWLSFGWGTALYSTTQDILELRKAPYGGTGNSVFNIYAPYTSSTDYVNRLRISAVAGSIGLTAESAGATGDANTNIVITPKGSGYTSLSKVLLSAGTATAGTAPLKFTSGTLNTAAEAGTVEFLTDAFYGTITTGAERKQFAFTSDLSGLVPYTGATTNVNLGLHNLTVDTDTLFVDSVNHRVGIRTTAPGAKLQINVDNIAATKTDGLILENSILSTAGVAVQMAPSINLVGHGWNTATGGFDEKVELRITSLLGSTNPHLLFELKEGSESWKTLLNIDQNGAFVTPVVVSKWDSRETLVLGLDLTADANATASYDQFSPYSRTLGKGWDGTATQYMSLGQVLAPENGTGSSTGVYKFFYGTSAYVPLINNELFRLEWGNRLGVVFNQNNTAGFTSIFNGNVGIGTTNPTAVLHLKAGTATASTSPLKFTSGTLLTIAEAGTVEFLTDAFYGTITTGAERKQFAFTSDLSGLVPYTGATTNVNLGLHNLTVDTNTLFVDSVNHRVGIGTTAPGMALDVNGSIRSNANIYFGGAGSITNTTFNFNSNGLGQIGNINTGTNSALSFLTKNVEAMRIDPSGKVGIGTTTPGYLLTVGSASVTDATVLLRLQDADSTCDFTANTGTPSCGSDITLKKNITEQLDNLTKILSLRPVTYNWLTDKDGVEVKHGFIAQEVESVMPELVTDGVWIDGTTKKFLQTAGMTPYIIGAIKEMNLKLMDINNFDKENDWRDSLIAWFANAKNQITRIFTGEICLTEVGEETICLNRTELQSLKALLNGVPVNSNPVISTPPIETCSDGVENQDETDIDTGGICTPTEILPETPIVDVKNSGEAILEPEIITDTEQTKAETTMGEQVTNQEGTPL